MRLPKHEDASTIVARVEQGMRNTQLLTDDAKIVSRWLYHIDHSYPVPTLVRDPALRVIQPWLAEQDIVSRGRFGAWMYEIGNMDHSVMQGVEAVNWLLEGEPETTWTGAQPQPTPTPVRTVSQRRDTLVTVIGSGRANGDRPSKGDLAAMVTPADGAETTTAASVGATSDAGAAGDGGED